MWFLKEENSPAFSPSYLLIYIVQVALLSKSGGSFPFLYEGGENVTKAETLCQCPASLAAAFLSPASHLDLSHGAGFPMKSFIPSTLKESPFSKDTHFSPISLV